MPVQKKKQSIISKLGSKLKTPKGRLVATLLIFAVIGGGIFVYRSFAATFYAWPYGRGFYPYSTNSSNRTVCPINEVNDKDSFGNTIPVISLACSTSNSQVYYAHVVSEGAAVVADSNAINGKSHNYRACVDFKGTGSVTVRFEAGDATTSTNTYFTNHQYGNLFCTTRSPFVSSARPMTARVHISSVTNTWINVRNVQLQRVN